MSGRQLRESVLLTEGEQTGTGTTTSPVLDFPSPSSVFDIDTRPATPPHVWLLQQVSLAVTNAALQTEFDREVAALTAQIKTTLDGHNFGYLIKVEIYANEYGVPIIAQGQLVFPVGPGIEPLDALAEDYRRPIMRSPPPQGFINSTQYVWFRLQDGKLVGSSQAPELRQSFEAQAEAEARRRNLLGAYYSIAGDGMIRVQRAAYWDEIARRDLNQITNAEKRQVIANLQQQFQATQDKFNQLYAQYQDTLVRYNQAQNLLGALNTIDLITGVVSGAIRSSQLISAGNMKQATNQGSPEISSSADRSATSTVSNSLMQELIPLVPQVNDAGDHLKSIDIQIRATYEGENVPISASEFPNIPPAQLPPP